MDIIDLIDKLLLLSEGIAKPRVYSYTGPDCANGLAVMSEGDPDMKVIGVVNLDTGGATKYDTRLTDLLRSLPAITVEARG